MNRIPVQFDPELLPISLRPLLAGAAVYDSSCSNGAKVYYISKDGGYYLKSAPKGALEAEAKMTRYFHGKGLSAEVLAYEQSQKDWLLTRCLAGEDCIHPQYLSDPKRLCDTLGAVLRRLHDTQVTDCPVPHRTEAYLESVGRNYRLGHFYTYVLPDGAAYNTPEKAWNVVQSVAPYLKEDTLIHGDYCLPNIILNNWAFSGFIDLGCGGMGDRHIDLFWGIWSLRFNLKTDAYADRFLDAYGRDMIDPEILMSIGAFEAFG